MRPHMNLFKLVHLGTPTPILMPFPTTWTCLNLFFLGTPSSGPASYGLIQPFSLNDPPFPATSTYIARTSIGKQVVGTERPSCTHLT